MSSAPVRSRFYLESVDVYQGVCVSFIVGFHTLLWWDESIDTNWLSSSLPVLGYMTFAQFLLMGIFFYYGINVANSLLQKTTPQSRKIARTRLLKRTVLFFLIAELSEAVAGLVNEPARLLNYLVTWELFHTYAASTLALLLVFEIAWKLDQRVASVRSVVLTVLITCWGVIMAVFFMYHDPAAPPFTSISAELNLSSIASWVIFETGQAPLIPWLAFTLIGGIIAVYLHAPQAPVNVIKIRMGMVGLTGIILTLAGILFLSHEIFISPPVHYPASTSYVLLTQGGNTLLFLVLFATLDLSRGLYSEKRHRWLLPLVQSSYLLFTVYIFHNVAFIIPSEILYLVFPVVTDNLVLGVGLCYSIVFYVLARPWSRVGFKYSLEWWINYFQNVSWKRW